jgi:hypothetical protein
MMPTFAVVRRIAAMVAADRKTSRRLSRFTCGDCEQSERCGLPPDDGCVIKICKSPAMATNAPGGPAPPMLPFGPSDFGLVAVRKVDSHP